MSRPEAPPQTHDVSSDAQRLRALHVPGQPLLLANVWSAPTARVVEEAGLPAIATASAAVAPVNGYADHGLMPADVAFAALRRIAGAVAIPVTADLEDGYGLSPTDLVERIVGAGACGLNLEDTDHGANTLVDMDRQVERIAAIRAAAYTLGVDLVINARIDSLLHGQSMANAAERGRRYIQAGADCLYPIFLSDLAAIEDFAALGPTNILWRPGGPRLKQLAAAGAARVSVGPYFFRLMLQKLGDAVAAFGRLDDDAAQL